ncbi:MAG: hypothetical protein NC191_07065 [Muribaculaceae bacterium]|nr:hypothetical protein [Muribaculaceae bacterium]
MNIQFLTPIITPKFNNKNNENSHNTGVMYSKLAALNKDTVCFTGSRDKVVKKATKAATTKFRDIMSHSYEKNIPEYRILGNRLMDVLESIAMKFKDRGVHFDREYCEHGAVKSTESFISKFIRSGEKPLDRIRSTLYVENPHDFKLINDILSELRDRGYELAKMPGSKKPDFDIRLADVTASEIKQLRSDLQDCISDPIPTGYEDIQFRLKDTTKKKAPPLEVLIIFGKETAQAKINESKYSYNIRRALKNLLHVNKVENPEVNSPAFRIKNNIKIICDTLSSAISRPLFTNAKNADYLHDDVRVPVELGEQTCESLRGLLEGIRDKIPRHYRAETQKVKSNDYDNEIVKLIKASPLYKERKDKTIYATDIVEMRKTLLSELKRYRTDDNELIQKIQAAMDETIEKYGSKPAKTAKNHKGTKSQKPKS